MILLIVFQQRIDFFSDQCEFLTRENEDDHSSTLTIDQTTN